MGLKQNCNVQSRTIKLQTCHTGIVVCHRVDVPRKCVILGVLNERHHILAKPFPPYSRCRHPHLAENAPRWPGMNNRRAKERVFGGSRVAKRVRSLLASQKGPLSRSLSADSALSNSR